MNRFFSDAWSGFLRFLSIVAQIAFVGFALFLVGVVCYAVVFAAAAFLGYSFGGASSLSNTATCDQIDQIVFGYVKDDRGGKCPDDVVTYYRKEFEARHDRARLSERWHGAEVEREKWCDLMYLFVRDGTLKDFGTRECNRVTVMEAQYGKGVR